jgi:hypothetical protein
MLPYRDTWIIRAYLEFEEEVLDTIPVEAAAPRDNPSLRLIRRNPPMSLRYYLQ